MLKKDTWDTSVFHTIPILQQLSSLTRHFENYATWPTINEYEILFKQYDLQITPVAQSFNISSFDEQYEPRVYLKGELQTRTHNWHDFFNALIWLSFPETKKALNKLHYSQASIREKGSNRSLLENRITQFDECGAIIISKSQEMLEMVKEHRWKELFINNHDQFQDNFRCIVFGHAIFEKALFPYIGMTCHCLLLHEDELYRENGPGNENALDRQLAEIWTNKIAKDPVRFYAFPILGIPGYWHNQDTSFYQNDKYFR